MKKELGALVAAVQKAERQKMTAKLAAKPKTKKAAAPKTAAPKTAKAKKAKSV